MHPCLLSLFTGLLATLQPDPSRAKPAVAGHQTRAIEGWTVHVSDRLLGDEKAATTRALDLLAVQLREIARVVPARAVGEMRRIPLWFNPEYPGVRPTAEYHPDAGWLRQNKRNPAMARAVEFTDIPDFEREMARMPNFTLHELAHGYHDRVLPGGFNNPDILAAFEKAKARGIYERVEQRRGDGRASTVRAYAMASPMEYFAECSEAYFSTNDFFPFTRGELAAHDPEMFNLLGKLWGDTTPEATTNHRNIFEEWKHSGSVWLLTTPEGADLPTGAKVEQFPVLVRLHRDFFDFSQARPGGEDLRVTSATGERLAFQIEDWNPENGTASVWVRVPLITGNSRQQIRLHWGNPKAAGESDGQAVFNPSNGYIGVWHMTGPVRDETGGITSTDTGTTATPGVIGSARRFGEGKGVSCGDKITSLPTGAAPSTTEAWFRLTRPNATLIGWGNEKAQGKVVMQFRSPPHIRMDCYFSGGNVESANRLALGEWTHVAHTYREGESRLYINGVLEGSNTRQDRPLNLKNPARLFLGGWYNQYDLAGDLDEVRVSRVVRPPEWVRLQYENQKPNQTLVGPLVQPGEDFSVSETKLELGENQTATIRARAGGAQKVLWIERRGGRESVVATDRFSHAFNAGRVTTSGPGGKGQGQAPATALLFKAIYANETRTKEIPITLRDDIPDPSFTLSAPGQWDGRKSIELVPRITNLPALEAKGAGKLNIAWTIEGVAVSRRVESDKLVLLRAQGDGPMRVTASIDNGGAKVIQSVLIPVRQPSPADEAWVPRPLAPTEQPGDNQFIPREGRGMEVGRHGFVVHSGTLAEAADSVFVRLFADGRLIRTETAKVGPDRKYSLAVKVEAGLVKYRTEFGSKTGDRESILHTAGNLVCGDVFLISGQSNAVATDFGKGPPPAPSEWVRTFGATTTDPKGSRLKLWAPAEARSPGGKSEIGYWGMELGRRLVESEGIPVCILNGAVGGTRIDQHQRNHQDPTDPATIYGRQLWRARQAGLTHGVRAILWHQGENDQGADGPTGGYGYETYRQFFVDLAASWKEDYPNVQHYYAFQIWPKACAMGVNGSDNRLREVQRTLPSLFSNLSVVSTLGIKPPGGCHFPAEGYAEFARLLHPMMRHHLYHQPAGPFNPPNLRRASFTSDRKDEVVLEFDQPVRWSDTLASQFHLAGKAGQVKAGSADGARITLKLAGPTPSGTITYLDSANWNPDNLLWGQNGLAALTFCEVPIDLPGARP